MLRIIEDRIIEGQVHYIEAAGLSTDDKPVTDIVSGSMFTEIDTRTIYLFDEEGDPGSEWVVFVQFPAPEA